MIEASQRIIRIDSQGKGGRKIRINAAVERYFDLQIKTLQNAPRDPDKLEQLLKVNQRQKEEAMHIDDTQMLIPDIEMLRVVLCLVSHPERRINI